MRREYHTSYRCKRCNRLVPVVVPKELSATVRFHFLHTELKCLCGECYRKERDENR